MFNSPIRDDININLEQNMINTMDNTMVNNDSISGIGRTGCGCNQPTMETPQQRVLHKNFFYEVPHICPINTKIVNHHIYRHTYSPAYTCTEENVVCHENIGSCCNFR